MSGWRAEPTLILARWRVRAPVPARAGRFPLPPERTAILGYLEDGDNLVTMAMNGWAAPEPAWWLSLQAHPEATVVAKARPPRLVRGRAATGVERERPWARWRGTDRGLDGYASLRPAETAVVVLDPAE